MNNGKERNGDCCEKAIRKLIDHLLDVYFCKGAGVGCVDCPFCFNEKICKLKNNQISYLTFLHRELSFLRREWGRLGEKNV